MPDKEFRGSETADPGQIHSRQEFARALTLIRERAGLTVRDVARKTRIPASTVGGYFGGRHVPPVKPPDQLQNILQVCGICDGETIEEWAQALSRVRQAPGKPPAGSPVPYRGLESFQPEDADWFFGREGLTEVLVGHVRSLMVTGGFLVAVGPSGSGKSSLLRAGLIPALRAGILGVAGSPNWPIVLFTPGAHPVHELAAQLAALAGGNRAGLIGSLLSNPDQCASLVRQCLRTLQGGEAHPAEQEYLILVVDQFEEIFTACPDEAERQAFIAALSAAAAPDGDIARTTSDGDCAATPTALVVLGLRADFYPHGLRCPQLVPAMQNRQLVVGPMTDAQLRSAIVEPARKARLSIEDGLVEVLLRDLTSSTAEEQTHMPDPGALPLMSHALLTTWERHRRGRLTVADYEAGGGIHGAVARTAEDVFKTLTSAEQELARRIFVRLVHVADDTTDTRRRVSRDELLFSGSDGPRVLDRFINRRLITADVGQVQIAHEALLLAWPRLRGWVDADRAGLRTHRQLTVAAEAWRDAGRDPNALYRGGPLATASDWATEPAHRADLNLLEREFLSASIEHSNAEGRAARRRTHRLQQLVAALTALVLLSGFLTFFAFRQQNSAARQRNLAISRQVAINADQLRNTDIALAMQLSLAAYRIAPTPEARSSLLSSYATPAVTRVLGPPGVMESVAFADGGRIMAAGGESTTVRLWNLTAREHPIPLGRPLTGHTDTVYSVAFSPDGRTLASGSGDKTIRLWNVTRLSHPVPWGPPLTGPANTVYSVAFSPDGQTLAAGSADDTVRLWRVANPRKPVPLGSPLTGPVGFVQSISFSSDGRLLAAGSADGTVWLWNVTSPSHPVQIGRPLIGGKKKVFTVAFSPDGKLLAAGGADNVVRLWNIGNPARPVPDGAPLSGPPTWINSIAFSPDGRSLAAASSDSKVWIWDLVTRKVTATLPHPAPVTTVSFLGKGITIATSAADGAARIWRIPGPLISGPTGPVFTTSFSAGSHILAVASADNTARLWNVTNPRQPVPLGPTITNAIQRGRATGAAAVSPDGATLVVGGVNGNCQVWDVRNPKKPTPLAQLMGPTAVVESIAFSPNGRLLAIASDDKTTWLWNITNPRHPVALGKPLTGPTNYVFSPAFSPNGRLLAVGGADKLVHLWDITEPSRPVPLPRPLAGASSYVYSVAFSPDGRTLAVGSADDYVRLWDVTHPRRPAGIGKPLAGPSNYVLSVAFSPDGRTLAATAGDGSIWLWNVARPSEPHVLATLTGSSGALFVDAFDSNRDILATGGADKQVRLWNTNPNQVAAYVCSIAGDRITKAEWNKYIPGSPYQPPC
jgi:WD40 repeat protein